MSDNLEARVQTLEVELQALKSRMDIWQEQLVNPRDNQDTPDSTTDANGKTVITTKDHRRSKMAHNEAAEWMCDGEIYGSVDTVYAKYYVAHSGLVLSQGLFNQLVSESGYRKRYIDGCWQWVGAKGTV